MVQKLAALCLHVDVRLLHGGTAELWNRGRWIPQGDAREGYRSRELKFDLEGERLHGGGARSRRGVGAWVGKEPRLLIQEKDDFTRPGSRAAIVAEHGARVTTGRTLEQITEVG